MDIIHDIPIKVLKSSNIIDYMPPQVPAPMVALELPRNNKLMRTIIDKMSKISRNVHLSASQCTNITHLHLMSLGISYFLSYEGLRVVSHLIFNHLLNFIVAGRITFRVEQATATIKTLYNGLQARYEMPHL